MCEWDQVGEEQIKNVMLSFYYFIEAFLKMCPNLYRYAKPDPYLGHSFDNANFVMIMCFH